MSQYNPHAIHRKVRVDQILEDGIVTWKTKSWTQPGNEDRYHPAIDFATCAVSCDCPDWQYRKAKHHPTTHSPETMLCKHLVAILTNLRRKAQ